MLLPDVPALTLRASPTGFHESHPGHYDGRSAWAAHTGYWNNRLFAFLIRPAPPPRRAVPPFGFTMENESCHHSVQQELTIKVRIYRPTCDLPPHASKPEVNRGSGPEGTRCTPWA